MREVNGQCKSRSLGAEEAWLLSPVNAVPQPHQRLNRVESGGSKGTGLQRSFRTNHRRHLGQTEQARVSESFLTAKGIGHTGWEGRVRRVWRGK